VRILLEIIVGVLLIALAWEKSLKERFGEIPWPGEKIAPVAKAPDHPRFLSTPTPTASGSWMWDPNRKSPLDPPAKKHPTSTPH
jgi:hypothetical protein